MEKIGELAAKVVAEHFPADTKKPIEVGGWVGSCVGDSRMGMGRAGGMGQQANPGRGMLTFLASKPRTADTPPPPPQQLPLALPALPVVLPRCSLLCSMTRALRPSWTAWRSSTPLPTWCR